MSPGLAGILAPGVMITRLIWLALASSIPVYVVVARFLAQGATASALPPALIATFGTVAAGLAVASLLLPRVYPSDALIGRLLDEEETPEAIAATLAPGHVDVKRLGQLDSTERRLLLIAPLFRAQAILRAALAEVSGLIGLALVILSGNFLYVVPFAALALITILLGYPRIEPMMERGRLLVRR